MSSDEDSGPVRNRSKNRRQSWKIWKSNNKDPKRTPGIVTAFKQQRMRACQPILTPVPVIVTFLTIGIIFVPVGVLMVVASNNVVEIEKKYTNCGDANDFCVLNISVDEKMQEPIYMYYKLTNYYQNHRRYVKSRTDAQLRGDKINSVSDLSTCAPMVTLDDSGDTSDILLPCGLVANSMFNDTFKLRYPNGSYVPLRKDGIAWQSDLDYKFGNPPNSAKGIRTINNFRDEDFIVWMRVAALPTFRKLYRIIETDLPKGDYSIEVNNIYPVDEFNGEKYVILTTVSWLGGKNSFLGWSYIAVGILCLVLGWLAACRQIIKPRKLGDPKYLRFG